MDKKLFAHEKFMKSEVEKIEHKLDKADTKVEKDALSLHITELTNYHNETVHNFQHERLIHLIVTIFFAALLFLAIFGMLVFTSMAAEDHGSYPLSIMSKILAIMLFVTELFYVRHYYQLENGTQRLYKYTEKLYQIGKR